MKALVYHGPGMRSWDEVPDPAIQQPTDAIVRIDSATICRPTISPKLKTAVFTAGPIPMLVETKTRGAKVNDPIWSIKRSCLKC